MDTFSTIFQALTWAIAIAILGGIGWKIIGAFFNKQ